MATRNNPLERLRGVCLALPEAEEFVSHGAPWFRIKKNRTFACFADNHHGDGRVATWVKSTPSTQELLVHARPDRYFVPPYVGKAGWIGVILDTGTDWSTLADLVRDGWRSTASKKLLTAAGDTDDAEMPLGLALARPAAGPAKKPARARPIKAAPARKAVTKKRAR